MTEKERTMQYETVRKLLQRFMKVHSNGQHIPQVIEFLRHWDAIRRGDEQPVFAVGPIYFGPVDTRGSLLRWFLAAILWRTESEQPTKILSYLAILEDNCDRSLAAWPLIKLVAGVERTPCTGFRNKRVHGGDGTRWEYYYFPDWFMAAYGRDAAKREAEVRV